MKKKILIISPQKWTNFYNSKHYYAIYLKKIGYDVYYLNPINYIFSKQFKFCEIKKNRLDIKIINVKIYLPYRLSRFFKFAFNLFLNFSLKFKKNNFDYIWNFDEKNFNLVNFFYSKKKIFQVMDMMDEKISSEQLSQIDYVITLSKELIKLPSDKKVIYISHGLSHFFYNKKKIFKKKNRKFKKKIVGIYGNFMSGRFDLDSLNEVVKKNSNLIFRFYGNKSQNHPYTNKNEGEELLRKITKINLNKNTFFYENLPKIKLSNSLNECDVFLYISSLQKNIDAHKLLELISFGKPILTSKFQNYKNNKNIIYFPKKNNSNDFNLELKKILKNYKYFNKKEFSLLRKKFALNRTYEAIISNILKKINE